jgi:hypothetical protein
MELKPLPTIAELLLREEQNGTLSPADERLLRSLIRREKRPRTSSPESSSRSTDCSSSK